MDRAPRDRSERIDAALRAFADATVDYEQLLEAVAREIAEIVGDACVVRLVEGPWLTAAALHLPLDEALLEAPLAEAIRAMIAAPIDLRAQAWAAQLVDAGEALVSNVVDMQSSPLAALAGRLQLRGYVSVALRVRGEGIGMLSVVRMREESPPFGDEERQLAQLLADHAALAITNARALEAARKERGRLATSLEAARDELAHAQKMHALGELAGSVAHDFNNLLTVIMSYASLAKDHVTPESRARRDLTEIARAAERAEELTRQLLEWSRVEPRRTRPLDLNAVVRAVEPMLARLVGDTCELRLTFSAEPAMVFADSGQLEQVIVNLAVNARDAMPDGGVVSVTVGEPTNGSPNPSDAPQAMVELIVGDTGTGMDEATRARIFEPFFTTKEPGKGTGLGLSIVAGVIERSGGTIGVTSVLDQGTTFTVRLPRSTRSARTSDPAPVEVARGGSETLLVVEDDDQVRRSMLAVLRRGGYEVLEARSGAEALAASTGHEGAIHLLLTDLRMPRTGGRELATWIRSARPSTKLAFLQKPVAPELLLRKVREMLDAS